MKDYLSLRNCRGCNDCFASLLTCFTSRDKFFLSLSIRYFDSKLFAWLFSCDYLFKSDCDSCNIRCQWVSICLCTHSINAKALRNWPRHRKFVTRRNNRKSKAPCKFNSRRESRKWTTDENNQNDKTGQRRKMWAPDNLQFNLTLN